MKSNKMLKLGILSLSIGALAACGKGSEGGTSKKGSSAAHVCEANTEAGWQSNGTKHWYKCKDTKCTKHVQEAEHTLGAEEVKQQADCENQEIKTQKCSICQKVVEKTSPALGHNYGDVTWTSRADCENDGTGTKTCARCGDIATETEQKLGHNYGEVTWTSRADCDHDGTGTKTCARCGDIATETEQKLGHDLEAVGGEETPEADHAAVRLYRCKRDCGTEYMGFKASEPSEASKARLVIDEDGGARFFGRPIGNKLELNPETGESVNREVGELVFDENETGDFFEYKFKLNATQAASLAKARLYCDAKPASYMAQNRVDFWKYGADSSDWTPGAYIEGEHKGEIISDFRYVLYVNGERKDLDASINTPVPSGDPRGEYMLPYLFNLKEGENTIKLVMSGGYRSVFYNFIFRPTTETAPDPEAHTHAWTAGDKIGTSALRPLTCTCGENNGYELQAADLTSGHKEPATSGQDNNAKNSRLGKNVFDDVWNIEGIAAGKYALYLNARASAGNSTNGYWNSATAIANGDKASNNGSTEALQSDYKYKLKIDEGEYINIGDVNDNYAACGIGEDAPAWTTKGLCEVTIAAGAKTLTIHNMNNGYSIWVYGARLVKLAA